MISEGDLGNLGGGGGVGSLAEGMTGEGEDNRQKNKEERWKENEDKYTC